MNDSQTDTPKAKRKSPSALAGDALVGGRPRAHLLVVEDEQDLLELLRFNLEREGYRVTPADSGEKALRSARAEAPDLVVLDIMLPGMDGLEVCRGLKAEESTAHVPIVMLTAKTEEADVVTGLEMGADDYITKPFSPRVLLARVKAVLRRRGLESADAALPEESIQIRDLVVRPDRHEVTVGGELVDLTATEFRLLTLLAGRPGRVFTRQQIIESIHGKYAAVTDRSVDVQIVMLRRKLGQRGDDIQTVRGVGYRFKE